MVTSTQSEIIKQTRKEWIAEGRRRFGTNFLNWKFKCPLCRRVNSTAEFEREFLSASSAMYMCKGRLYPGEGCNWKANSKFRPQNQGRIIVTESGKEVDVFDFADVEGQG